MPKFGRKVNHLRCDAYTSFKVKRSKVRVRGGRGHTVSAERGGHTACFIRVLDIVICCLPYTDLPLLDLSFFYRAMLMQSSMYAMSNLSNYPFKSRSYFLWLLVSCQ